MLVAGCFVNCATLSYRSIRLHQHHIQNNVKNVFLLITTTHHNSIDLGCFSRCFALDIDSITNKMHQVWEERELQNIVWCNLNSRQNIDTSLNLSTERELVHDLNNFIMVKGKSKPYKFSSSNIFKAIKEATKELQAESDLLWDCKLH